MYLILYFLHCFFFFSKIDIKPCKKLIEAKNITGDTALKNPFQRLLIMNSEKNDTKKQYKCHDEVLFEEQLKKNGWCFTCVNGSRPGEPGYCGNKMNTDESDEDNNVRKIDLQ